MKTGGNYGPSESSGYGGGLPAGSPRPPVLRRLTPYRYEIALVLTIVVWGLNFPVMKLALAEMNAHAVNALRFTAGVAVLGALAWRDARRRRAPFFAPLRAHGPLLFGLALLGYVAYQVCFVVGLPRTSSGSGALLLATSPLWTALLSHVTRAERLSRAGWGGLALSLAGAVVVVWGSHAGVGGRDTLAGNLLMLGGSFIWAFYTTFSRRLSGKVTPEAVSFFEIAMALPFLLAIAAFSGEGVRWGDIGPAVWFAIVYSGCLSVGVTFVVWNAAVAHVGPASTAAFSNLTPFVAALAGLAVLGEPITAVQIAGGLLLLGGLVWMRRGKRPAAPADPGPVFVADNALPTVGVHARVPAGQHGSNLTVRSAADLGPVTRQ